MTCSCTSKNDSRFFLLVRGKRNINFNTRKYRSSSVVAVDHSRQPDAWRKKFKFYFLVVCTSKNRGLILLLAVLENRTLMLYRAVHLWRPSMSSVVTRYLSKLHEVNRRNKIPQFTFLSSTVSTILIWDH